MNTKGKKIYLETKVAGYLADFEFGLILKKHPELKIRALHVDLDNDYKPTIYKKSKLLQAWIVFVSTLFNYLLKRVFPSESKRFK
jgi:hypothetical protein